jgi:hypothetical protein
MLDSTTDSRVRHTVLQNKGHLLLGHKYAGVNILRATKKDIGTVEYRYSSGSKNPDRILEYILMSTWCKDFVKNYTSGIQIVETFIRSGSYENWIDSFVPRPVADSFMKGLEHIVGQNFPTSLELEAAITLSHAAFPPKN